MEHIDARAREERLRREETEREVERVAIHDNVAELKVHGAKPAAIKPAGDPLRQEEMPQELAQNARHASSDLVVLLCADQAQRHPRDNVSEKRDAEVLQ